MTIDQIPEKQLNDIHTYQEFNTIVEQVKTNRDVSQQNSIDIESESVTREQGDEILKAETVSYIIDQSEVTTEIEKQTARDNIGVYSKDEVDDLINSNIIPELTYSQLQLLVASNSLIPGKRYLLKGYKTLYYILNSNSSGIIRNKTITSVVSGYAVLDNTYAYDLSVGMTVTVTELPVGYVGAITVGSTTTVTVNSSSFYFRFANGMHNTVGFKFEYFLNRYSGIPNDSIIKDTNGKPVLKPMGIINSEVHDGTAYMSMSASDNLSVPEEDLVLIANSLNTFEAIAESKTFIGDFVYYNFTDNQIKNDNEQVIGDRPGFITRRFNDTLKIDLEVDWRCMRYRRWRLSDASITKFIHQDQLVTSRVGYDSKYIYTAKNASLATPNKFYLAQKPEGTMLSLDAEAKVYSTAFTVNSNTDAIDYGVLKLDSPYNPVSVQIARVYGTLSNTIFQGIGGEFNFSIRLELRDSGFFNCTFVSNPQIYDAHIMTFTDCIFLDSATISGVLARFDNCKCLSFTAFAKTDSAEIHSSVFGTINANITGNTGTIPTISWIVFTGITNSKIYEFAFGTRAVNLRIDNSHIINSALFSYYSAVVVSSDGVYQQRLSRITGSTIMNADIRLTQNTERLNFVHLKFPNNNPSHSSGRYQYDITTPLSFKEIKLSDSTRKLYSTNLDASDVLVSEIISTPIV